MIFITSGKNAKEIYPDDTKRQAQSLELNLQSLALTWLLPAVLLPHFSEHQKYSTLLF